MQEDVENLDTEAKTVGELLRNTRIKKGLTISDVSAELCIRKFYINAIENMDMANLPPLPYGLGFVRSYAKYLGLNGDRIVSSYRQGSGLAADDEDEAIQTHEATHPHFKHLLIALLGFVVLYFAWNYASENSFKDGYEESNSTQVIAEPVIVDENGIPVDTNELKEVFGSQDDETEGENNKSEDVAIEIEQEKKSDLEITQSSQEQNKEQIKATPIEMEVIGPSWIEVKQGNDVLLNGIYSGGYKYVIEPQKGIVITVGRPNNVIFKQNGEKIKVVSSMKKKNVSLDEFFE